MHFEHLAAAFGIEPDDVEEHSITNAAGGTSPRRTSGLSVAVIAGLLATGSLALWLARPAETTRRPTPVQTATVLEGRHVRTTTLGARALAPPSSTVSVGALNGAADVSAPATEEAETPAETLPEAAPPSIVIVYRRADPAALDLAEQAADRLRATLRIGDVTLRPGPGQDAPGIGYFFVEDSASADAVAGALATLFHPAPIRRIEWRGFKPPGSVQVVVPASFAPVEPRGNALPPLALHRR